MLFNSFEFIFVFFPLVLTGYALLQRKKEMEPAGKREKMFLIGLLVMSLVFYGWLYPKCVPILLLSMAWNYILARKIMGSAESEEKFVSEAESVVDESDRVFKGTAQKEKKLLILGISLNVVLLAVFKYLHLTAPGISFFTFTQIAFLVECYRGTVLKLKPLEYGLYVSFFPKLIQGPIALPGEMLEQFEKYRLKVDWEQIFRGTFLFVLGLFKKVIIADTLGAAVDFGYANPAGLNSGEAWIIMLSYTLQLYFDFSGYCDMAMGIARVIGFELPLNFNSPYKAANIIEFWDRWHITLTKFFTKYVYIPLGGSRKGTVRTYINCLVVFFISGLWHGTGWQFLVWGMMHGVLNVFTRMWKRYKERKGFVEFMPRFISVFLTFLYVNAAWVFFRAPSVTDAIAVFKNILAFDFGRINKNLAACFNLEEFWYVIKVLRLDGWQYAQYILMVLILAFLLILIFKAKTAAEYVKTAKPSVVNMLLMTLLFVWSVLSLSGVSSFLYFNF